MNSDVRVSHLSGVIRLEQLKTAVARGNELDLRLVLPMVEWTSADTVGI